MKGILSAVKRYKEMGFRVTSSVLNRVLLASVMNESYRQWRYILEHLHWRNPNDHTRADDLTYAILMMACKKYNRPNDAIKWFEEALAGGIKVTPFLSKSLRSAVGDEVFEEFKSRQSVEDQSHMTAESVQQETRKSPETESTISSTTVDKATILTASAPHFQGSQARAPQSCSSSRDMAA